MRSEHGLMRELEDPARGGDMSQGMSSRPKAPSLALAQDWRWAWAFLLTGASFCLNTGNGDCFTGSATWSKEP